MDDAEQEPVPAAAFQPSVAAPKGASIRREGNLGSLSGSIRSQRRLRGALSSTSTRGREGRRAAILRRDTHGRNPIGKAGCLGAAILR